MAALAFVVTTLIALACALLLAKGYLRSRNRMLFWSSLCFAGLTIANAMGFVDLNILPATDLFPLRLTISAGSLALLVFGFIWEAN